EHDISLLENDIVPPCTDRYLLAAYDTTATALDYLDDALLFICEPQAVRKRHKNLITLHTEELLSLKSQGLLPKKHSGCYADDFDALTFGRAEILADSFTRSTEESRLDALINVRGSVVPRWSGELVLLEEDIQAGLALGYSCVVLAATARGAAALANDLRTAGFDCIEGAETPPPPPSVSISVGSLSSGFQLAAGQLCVLTSAKETKTGKKRARHAEKQGHSIARLEDLKAGDFVVHDSHGIGRFEGIHRIDHHGFVRDYIKIAYRGADVLYVPVTQLDLVSQYVSPRDDAEVKLAKLHSGEWAKTKAAVYRSVREMAKELIELYAVREKEQGVAFSPDGEWQNTFESRFEYDETD
ncbi:MAG: CarD family transcriptional regulator, partial [Oscillospiraceae bacterium]